MAGVTPRTVRYYVQQGLLTPPGTRGPGARYDGRHLQRITLIRRLQSEHLPLAVIRERLAALSDAEIAHQIAEPAGPRAVPDATPASAPTRSQWDRIALSRDVELHIRRPLSRERNKQVECLLEEARRIMRDGAWPAMRRSPGTPL